MFIFWYKNVMVQPSVLRKKLYNMAHCFDNDLRMNEFGDVSLTLSIRTNGI